MTHTELREKSDRASAPALGDARVLHPGRWRWLRALGWMLALFVGVVALFVTVRYGSLITIDLAFGMPWSASTDGPASVQLISIALAAAAVLIAYTGAVGWGEGRRVEELDLSRMPVELFGGLVVGGLVMTATILGQRAGGAVTIDPQPIRSVLNAVGESIKSGVLEETLLRLVVFRLLWRASNAWVALAASALLFGLIHLLNPNSSLFAAICIAFEAGILLAAFYILTRRAWMSIGVHAGWNFTLGWIFGAAVSGSDGFAGGPLVTRPIAGVPAWLSGGQFGPEASLMALLICTMVGFAMIGLAWSRGNMRSDRLRPVVVSA